MAVFLAVPPALINLQQEGLLERSFWDGLFPNMLYRMDIARDEWQANTGSEIFETRPGLLAPNVTPIQAGTDPVPQVVSYEQWIMRLQRYAGTIDTNSPTSALASSDLFLRNVQQLGLQAGQSINRVARNFQFKSYLSGQTVTTAVTAVPDLSIRVASLNGFREVVIKGTNVRPQPVSTAFPLPITITGAGANTCVGAVPDDPADPDGPGTLTLGAAVGFVLAARVSVLSGARPKVIRVGGASSVDGISAVNTFTMQALIEAVSYLRKQNVQPHEDGFYHLHMNADANSQVFQDAAWRQLQTALPDGVYMQTAWMGTIAGASSYLNNESPDTTNVGALISTGASAFYGTEIGAEVVNATGVNIARCYLTGRAHAYERTLDEKKYITEAGLTGKLADFNVVNNGLEVSTEGVRLVIRSPIDRLQDLVAATWSISSGFAIPTDVTAGNSANLKRAVCIEHAANS